MRGLLGRAMHGVVDDALDEFSPVVGFSASSRSVDETGHALLGEASSPSRHRIVAGVQLLGDVAVLHPLSGQQQDVYSERLAYAGTT